LTTTITSKGQVTIPAGIRKVLGLNAGDKIDFVLKEGNQVEIIPVNVSIKSLKGSVPKSERIVGVEEMNQVIENYHDRN